MTAYELSVAFSDQLQQLIDEKIARIRQLNTELYKHDLREWDQIAALQQIAFERAEDDDDVDDSDLKDDDVMPTPDELIDAEFNTGERDPEGN